MNRRELVIGAPVVALTYSSLSVYAQPTNRHHKIGFISLRSGPGEFDAAFREQLRTLGYVPGETVDLQFRWAAESEQRALEFATALVEQRADIIVAATTGAIRAAMRATKTIPIVMAAAADPLATGLVASLARPGGNVTGLTLLSNDTGAKRLQLLRELLPSAERVGVLFVNRGVSDDGPINTRLLEQLRAAASELGLSLHTASIRSGLELDEAFAAFTQARAQAVLVPINSVVIDNRTRLVTLAKQHRLPTMYEAQMFVMAGGLLSYGPSLLEMYRRAAVFVDRIIRGASPSDLPVEQPTKFEFGINLKTAKELNLAVAPSLLARADEVIE
jgi:putative tryptophan/tyrosine transport system substrate-binding protein